MQIGVSYTVKWGEPDDRVLGDSTCHRMAYAMLGHPPPLHTYHGAGCQTVRHHCLRLRQQPPASPSALLAGVSYFNQ